MFPIMSTPISPVGLRTTEPQPLVSAYQPWVGGQPLLEQRWEGRSGDEWEWEAGPVSLCAPQEFGFFPGGQAGGKSYTQISIWAKEPTKFHSITKAFKIFSGKEFLPLLQIVTHSILLWKSCQILNLKVTHNLWAPTMCPVWWLVVLYPRCRDVDNRLSV